jgi:WD40 repeat protein
LNETNVDKVENLATFGSTRENCLISSYQDATIETGFVNGQAEYLLALMNLDKNLEIQNIQLWDLVTKKNIQTFNSNEIDSVLFHPDNRTLISFSRYEPGRLTLWDMQNGNPRQEFHLEPDKYYGDRISISQDGLRIAFLFWSPNLVNWQVSEFNLQTNQISSTIYVFPLYGDIPIPPHTYEPKGNLVTITYNSDNKQHFLDLTNHKDTILEFPFSNLNDIGLAEAQFETLAISSNERYVVGGALNGDIYLWTVIDGTLLKVFKAHTTQRSDGWLGAIKILEFSPESNLLLSVGYDGFIKLWDTNSRVLLKELDTCHHFGGFTQDGRYLVAVGKKGVELWGIP